jgi:hypothetical protein
MRILKQGVLRLLRGVAYTATLAVALVDPSSRRLLWESLALANQLPGLLEQPLPEALCSLTPTATSSSMDPETIRQIVDAITAFGAGRPLGICLRRSLLRYHFLRRANLPVVVHFGARRLDQGLGGHAWLTLHGQPYHEKPEHYQAYALMYTFPESG